MSDTKNKTLTAKQARHLRGLGHHLKPVVYLGKEGIDKNLLVSLEAVLKSHELVKVKVGTPTYLIAARLPYYLLKKVVQL